MVIPSGTIARSPLALRGNGRSLSTERAVSRLRWGVGSEAMTRCDQGSQFMLGGDFTHAHFSLGNPLGQRFVMTGHKLGAGGQHLGIGHGFDSSIGTLLEKRTDPFAGMLKAGGVLLSAGLVTLLPSLAHALIAGTQGDSGFENTLIGLGVSIGALLGAAFFTGDIFAFADFLRTHPEYILPQRASTPQIFSPDAFDEIEKELAARKHADQIAFENPQIIASFVAERRDLLLLPGVDATGLPDDSHILRVKLSEEGKVLEGLEAAGTPGTGEIDILVAAHGTYLGERQRGHLSEVQSAQVERLNLGMTTALAIIDGMTSAYIEDVDRVLEHNSAAIAEAVTGFTRDESSVASVMSPNLYWVIASFDLIPDFTLKVSGIRLSEGRPSIAYNEALILVDNEGNILDVFSNEKRIEQNVRLSDQRNVVVERYYTQVMYRQSEMLSFTRDVSASLDFTSLLYDFSTIIVSEYRGKRDNLVGINLEVQSGVQVATCMANGYFYYDITGTEASPELVQKVERALSWIKERIEASSEKRALSPSRLRVPLLRAMHDYLAGVELGHGVNFLTVGLIESVVARKDDLVRGRVNELKHNIEKRDGVLSLLASFDATKPYIIISFNPLAIDIRMNLNGLATTYSERVLIHNLGTSFRDVFILELARLRQRQIPSQGENIEYVPDAWPDGELHELRPYRFYAGDEEKINAYDGLLKYSVAYLAQHNLLPLTSVVEPLIRALAFSDGDVRCLVGRDIEGKYYLYEYKADADFETAHMHSMSLQFGDRQVRLMVGYDQENEGLHEYLSALQSQVSEGRYLAVPVIGEIRTPAVEERRRAIMRVAEHYMERENQSELRGVAEAFSRYGAAFLMHSARDVSPPISMNVVQGDDGAALELTASRENADFTVESGMLSYRPENDEAINSLLQYLHFHMNRTVEVGGLLSGQSVGPVDQLFSGICLERINNMHHVFQGMDDGGLAEPLKNIGKGFAIGIVSYFMASNRVEPSHVSDRYLSYRVVSAENGLHFEWSGLPEMSADPYSPDILVRVRDGKLSIEVSERVSEINSSFAQALERLKERSGVIFNDALVVGTSAVDREAAAIPVSVSDNPFVNNGVARMLAHVGDIGDSCDGVDIRSLRTIARHIVESVVIEETPLFLRLGLAGSVLTVTEVAREAGPNLMIGRNEDLVEDYHGYSPDVWNLIIPERDIRNISRTFVQRCFDFALALRPEYRETGGIWSTNVSIKEIRERALKQLGEYGNYRLAVLAFIDQIEGKLLREHYDALWCEIVRYKFEQVIGGRYILKRVESNEDQAGLFVVKYSGEDEINLLDVGEPVHINRILQSIVDGVRLLQYQKSQRGEAPSLPQLSSAEEVNTAADLLKWERLGFAEDLFAVGELKFLLFVAALVDIMRAAILHTSQFPYFENRYHIKEQDGVRQLGIGLVDDPNLNFELKYSSDGFEVTDLGDPAMNLLVKSITWRMNDILLQRRRAQSAPNPAH